MRLGLWSLVISGLIIVVPGCGKRGPPLPPFRPAPGPVTDLSLTRRGDEVAIRFLAPSVNTDGSQPVLFDRVEVYALTMGAGGLPPNGVQLIQKANLLTVLGRVEPADANAATATPADAKPAAGAARLITFIDKGILVPPPVVTVAAPVVAAPVTPEVPSVAAPPTAIRYYLFQAFANNRRAGAVETVGVPLGDPPLGPEGAVLKYDEQTLTLSWTLTPGDSYFVYPSGADVLADARPLNPQPLKVATIAQPVMFGKRACFVVRSVVGLLPVSSESAPSNEACVTPADTFPPPAPGGLVALATPGAISLTWDAVTAADLAGYIVLRGEGSGDRLQPLMAEPVAGTSFTDQTAKAGVRYFYAVVAVDGAASANRSKNSNLVEETGR